MDAFLTFAGAVVVLVTILDIYFTVLFPASRHGPVRKPLSAVIWGVFRVMRKLTHGQRRRNLLSYAGPIVIAATMVVWFALLALGFAMLFKPALGTGVVAGSGPTDTDWVTAIYYGAYNLTTLGLGEFEPTTAAYRLLTVAAAAIGFAYFSMAITYFLSVYSNLTSRNAFAQGLNHLTARTGDAAELVARLADGNDLGRALQQLGSKADFLCEVQQSHAFYPVLRYFHYRDSQYALPRILLIAFDTAALLRSAPGPDLRPSLLRSPDLASLEYSAEELLEGLGAQGPGAAPSPDREASWRRRFEEACALFEFAGIELSQDRSAAASEYVAFRAKWDGPLRQVTEAMLYEWTDIDCVTPVEERSPAREGSRTTSVS